MNRDIIKIRTDIKVRKYKVVKNALYYICRKNIQFLFIFNISPGSFYDLIIASFQNASSYFFHILEAGNIFSDFSFIFFCLRCRRRKDC